MNDPIFILTVVMITLLLSFNLLGKVMIDYFDNILDGRTNNTSINDEERNV